MSITDNKTLIREVGEWHIRNYPNADAGDVLHKLCEEVGELCGAFQKKKWTTDFFSGELFDGREFDALGNIMICLAGYCYKRNLDLDTAIYLVWEQVKRRSKDRILNEK